MQPIKISQKGSLRLSFIKDFTFVSELSGNFFFYKYAFNSQIVCLRVCADEDLGPFWAESLTSNCAALQQTNKKNRTKFDFEKKLSENVFIFRNLEVFHILRESST